MILNSDKDNFLSKNNALDNKIIQQMNNTSAMNLSELNTTSYFNVDVNSVHINDDNTPYIDSDNKKDNELFYYLAKIKTDLLKECLESTSWYLGETHNDIQYINYAKNIPIQLQNTGTFGDLSGLIGSTGEGFSILGGYLSVAQQSTNAKIIYGFLINTMHLTAAGAVGAIANILQESGLNPGAYNKAEQSNTYKGSSANGSGYGAGIIQWSNAWKTSVERQINMKIEQAPLNVQLALLAQDLMQGILNSRYKYFKYAETLYQDPQHLTSAWLASVEMPSLWKIFVRTGTCDGKGQEINRIINVGKVINLLKS